MHQALGVAQDPPRARGNPKSVYERVMADEETRHAFFHATQGLLYGNPDHEEVKAVEKMLEEASIAYLLNPVQERRRPLFRSQGMTGVGLEEIAGVVSRLASDR